MAIIWTNRSHLTSSANAESHAESTFLQYNISRSQITCTNSILQKTSDFARDWKYFCNFMHIS